MSDFSEKSEETNSTKRVETGVVQFNDDWQGVFIRGDDSMFYSLVLQQAIYELKKNKHYSIVDRTKLEELVRLLSSSDERITEKTIQKIKFNETDYISE